MTSMFEKIGVRVEWRRNPVRASGGRFRCEAPIEIQFDAKIPEGLDAGVVARTFFPMPDQIRVSRFFWIGSSSVRETRRNANMLGNVMAHELTHAIQGECRHSSTALMKPRFEWRDIQEMMISPLQFDDGDTRLIKVGLSSLANQRAPRIQNSLLICSRVA